MLPLSWAFCENCLSVFYEFFRSMIRVASQWEPLFFRGAVAYMDVGKGREQDAEALEWRLFLVTFLSCSKKVTRPRCEYRNA